MYGTSPHFCSVAQSCLTLFNPMDCSTPVLSLSFSIIQSLFKLLSIESVMPSNHLILGHPLLLLPSIFPSIRVFITASVHRIRWPKYWSFNFSISPSNEYSGLISFRIDWFELHAVSLLPGPNETPELLGRTCFLHHCMEKLVTKHGNAMKLMPIGQNLTKEKQETRRSPQVRTSLF